MRPSPIYLTTGKKQSALFAADETTLALALPQTTEAALYHWKENGILYEKSNLTWNGNVLEGKVKKWELVVLVECNLK